MPGLPLLAAVWTRKSSHRLKVQVPSPPLVAAVGTRKYPQLRDAGAKFAFACCHSRYSEGLQMSSQAQGECAKVSFDSMCLASRSLVEGADSKHVPDGLNSARLLVDHTKALVDVVAQAKGTDVKPRGRSTTRRHDVQSEELIANNGSLFQSECR